MSNSRLKPGVSYKSSDDDRYLDAAVKAHWTRADALSKELAAFTPKTIDEFAQQKKLLLDQLKAYNKDKTVADLEAFAVHEIALRAQPEVQAFVAFDDHVRSEYVSGVIIAGAFCEALANRLLTIGLGACGKGSAVVVLEKVRVVDKWITAPTFISDLWEFPVGGPLHEALAMLFKERNIYVHHKPSLTIGEEEIVKQRSPMHPEYCVQLNWLRRFLSLPYDLANLAHQQLGLCMHAAINRKPVEVAPEHRSG